MYLNSESLTFMSTLEASQNRTRLDRLFHLLTQGATSAIRRTAMDQLLPMLTTAETWPFNRLFDGLLHSSWETRRTLHTLLDRLFARLSLTDLEAMDPLLSPPDWTAQDWWRVLIHGKPLLAQQSTFYENQWLQESGQEKMKRVQMQKAALQERLGLEVMQVVEDKDMDEDENEKNDSPDTAKEDVRELLSQREQFMKKRKQNLNSSNVEMDSVMDFIYAIRDHILHPHWEKRHGALLGMKALVVAPFFKAEECQNLLKEWIWYCLCCLILDQFDDYVGDTVTAPVRETCAQVLSLMALHFPDLFPWSVLKMMEQRATHWQTKHGIHLTLKYSVALQKKKTDLWRDWIASWKEALLGQDDEIRFVVAETCLLLDAEFLQQMDLLPLLWRVLQQLDEMTTSTQPLLLLLCQCLQEREMTLQQWQWVLPFMRHSSFNVKKSVFDLLLARPIQKLPIWQCHVIQVWQWLLLEHDERVRERMHLYWQRLVSCASSDWLDELLKAWPEWKQIITTSLGHAALPLKCFHWFPLNGETQLDAVSASAWDSRLYGEEKVISLQWESILALSQLLSCASLQQQESLVPLFLSLASNESRKCWQRVFSWLLLMGIKGVSGDTVLTWMLEAEKKRAVPVDCHTLYQTVDAAYQQFTSLYDKDDIPLHDCVQDRTFPTDEINSAYRHLQDHYRRYSQMFQLLEQRLFLLPACVLIQSQYRLNKVTLLLKTCMNTIKKESFPFIQFMGAKYLAQWLKEHANDPSRQQAVSKCAQQLLQLATVSYCQWKDTEEECFTLNHSEWKEDVAERGARKVIQHLLAEQLQTDWLKEALSLALTKTNKELLMRALSLNLLQDKITPTDWQNVFHWMKHSSSVVRYGAHLLFCHFCQISPHESLVFIVNQLLPLLATEQEQEARRGASECLYLYFHSNAMTQPEPWWILVMQPCLRGMSDRDTCVRDCLTRVFRQLMPLLPVLLKFENDAAEPHNPFIERIQQESQYFQPLVDAKKAENFPLRVPLQVQLRSYQQEGVNWLHFLVKYHLHGILCDDMGLGKTIQTLAMISSLHEEQQERCLPSLIVCPASVAGHWLHETRQVTRNLNPFVYLGMERQHLSQQLDQHPSSLIITSYDCLRGDCVLLRMKWLYVVLDEGHVIKSGKSKIFQSVKQLQSEHRLLLSGTPIQNRVDELWALFDFLMPGYLGSEKQFHEQFTKPIASGNSVQSNAALDALHKQVLPLMLRRLKEDVLQELPPKVIQDVVVDLTAFQWQCYQSLCQQEKRHLHEDIQETKQSKHVFQALQELRKVCQHPLLLGEKHAVWQEERVANALKETKYDWMDWRHSSKLKALQELLYQLGFGDENNENNENNDENNVDNVTHRLLIFCQQKQSLDLLERFFKLVFPRFTYLRLDGSVDALERQNLVHRFNHQISIDALLLTTSIGGLGLNLTGADIVLFLEQDWNPMKDLQAMDRAHRLGQKRVVQVFRLITRDTIEEKLMSLQKFKLHVANSVVTQQNTALSSMGTDQLLDLFETSLEKRQGESNADSTTVDLEQHSGLPKAAQAVMKALGQLWNEEEYEDAFNMESFLEK